MKELKENLKFKFQKFGWPGDLRVKIDKSYHYTKQGKIFVLVTEIDTSFSLLLEPTDMQDMQDNAFKYEKLWTKL